MKRKRQTKSKNHDHIVSWGDDILTCSRCGRYLTHELYRDGQPVCFPCQNVLYCNNRGYEAFIPEKQRLKNSSSFILQAIKQPIPECEQLLEEMERMPAPIMISPELSDSNDTIQDEDCDNIALPPMSPPIQQIATDKPPSYIAYENLIKRFGSIENAEHHQQSIYEAYIEVQAQLDTVRMVQEL
jgi:hypothetical protein